MQRTLASDIDSVQQTQNKKVFVMYTKLVL